MAGSVNPSLRRACFRKLIGSTRPTLCSRSWRAVFSDGFPCARGTLRRPQTADGATFPRVSCQPFQLMSKTMPLGSLNLRSNPLFRLAEIKEKLSARLFNLLLLRRQVVALKPEMVDADKAFRHAGADLAFYISSARLISPSLI